MMVLVFVAIFVGFIVTFWGPDNEISKLFCKFLYSIGFLGTFYFLSPQLIESLSPVLLKWLG